MIPAGEALDAAAQRRPPSSIANSHCSIRPSQNDAIASPDTVIRRTTWSKALLRRSAASTPSGMPATMVTSIDASVSSIVAGNRANRSSATGRVVNRLLPRSPCSTFK